MTEGLLFDYGGTLDTRGDHWGQVIWKAYQHCGVPVTNEHFRAAYVHGERTLARVPLIKPWFTFYQTLSVKLRVEMDFLLENGHWNASERALKNAHAAVLDTLYQTVKEVTAESRDILTQLRKRYPMVLVSNFYGNVNAVLEEMEMNTLFDTVVESAVVGVRKPDPKIFALGVEALHLPADKVAVIGDSFYKDILPAKEVGCQTVWFKGEGWTNETYDETLPTRVITSLAQLLPMFMERNTM